LRFVKLFSKSWDNDVLMVVVDSVEDEMSLKCCLCCFFNKLTWGCRDLLTGGKVEVDLAESLLVAGFLVVVLLVVEIRFPNANEDGEDASKFKGVFKVTGSFGCLKFLTLTVVGTTISVVSVIFCSNNESTTGATKS
jgi:hypothetical protein